MQINVFSDYTLRILIYLAPYRDRVISCREIAEAYDLSFDHIAKAAQFLARHDYLHAVRGRGGGVRLAKAPSEIAIGEILRLTEANTGLVECMRPGPTHCLLAPFCSLAPLLDEAVEAFFLSLDKRTLADLMPMAEKFREINES